MEKHLIINNHRFYYENIDLTKINDYNHFIHQILNKYWLKNLISANFKFFFKSLIFYHFHIYYIYLYVINYFIWQDLISSKIN